MAASSNSSVSSVSAFKVGSDNGHASRVCQLHTFMYIHNTTISSTVCDMLLYDTHVYILGSITMSMQVWIIIIFPFKLARLALNRYK